MNLINVLTNVFPFFVYLCVLVYLQDHESKGLTRNTDNNVEGMVADVTNIQTNSYLAS